jgi:hypothetical protein
MAGDDILEKSIKGEELKRVEGKVKPVTPLESLMKR